MYNGGAMNGGVPAMPIGGPPQAFGYVNNTPGSYQGTYQPYVPQQQYPVQQSTQNVQDYSQISTNTNNKDPTMVKSRVFVGNLNTFRIDRNDVINLFQDYGTILAVNLCKGYAFIQFSNPIEAEMCVKSMKGYKWEGSELDIKLAFTDPPKNKKNQKNENNDNKHPEQSSSVNTKSIFESNRRYAAQYEPVEVENHYEGSKEDVLICGECRFRTNNIDAFVRHKKKECSMILKTPKEPEAIQCFTCDDLFPTSWNLLRHMVTRHNLNLYRDPNNPVNEDSNSERRGPRTPSPLPSEDAQQDDIQNGKNSTEENNSNDGLKEDEKEI